MKTIVCCVCGIEFSVPDELETARRRDHANFFCPNGHRLYFPGKSVDQRISEMEQRIEVLQKRLEEASVALHWYSDVHVPNLQAKIDRLKQELKSARLSAAAYRTHARKLKENV